MWEKLKNSKQSTRVAILFGVIAVFVIMIVFSGNGDTTTNTNETAEEVSKEVVNKTIDLNDELDFQNFRLTMNPVIIYEEDGALLADVSFKWLNQANGGEKTFMQVAAMDVKQGDDSLVEINNAWQEQSSDVYFPNAEQGEWEVELTYQLENAEDSLEIIFVPMTDEGSNQLTIDLN